MKISFQRRFAAVLGLAALLSYTFMSGPPGGGLMGGGVPTASQPQSQAGGALTSNSTNVHPRNQTTGINSGAVLNSLPGAYYLYSVREVEGSFAQITLPSAMFLVDVACESGAAGGTIEIGYAASNNAHFICPASGTDATGAIGLPYVHHVPVNWAAPATIPSATFTANGGAQAATLTFSTMSSTNPDISAYRAMYEAAAFANTTAVTETITFDNGPAVARAVVAFLANTTGSITGVPYAYVNYANGSQYTQQIPCQGATGPLQVVPLQPVAASYNFTSSYKVIGLGGTTDITIYGVWFY